MNNMTIKSNGVLMAFSIILLASCTKSHNDHQYVDLGLSVLWATCNIGASAPEEYGDYFAWGATEPFYKTGYAQENPQQHWKKGKELGYTCVNAPYQTVKTTQHILTRWSKYGKDINSVYIDANAIPEEVMKEILDPEDDAAHAIWGGEWRIPTQKEIDELLKYCVWMKTKQNGIEGLKVRSKVAGHTNDWIFIPLSGFYTDYGIAQANDNGYFWSSSVCTFSPGSAECLHLRPHGKIQVLRNRMTRYSGLPIRPVLPKTAIQK